MDGPGYVKNKIRDILDGTPVTVVMGLVTLFALVGDDFRQWLTDDLHHYIDQFGSVAAWGAGHQALAMLSLANLGDKIRYIIDDAPFKQNKYSPATHIPIVSSKNLDIDPVDSVIVMAASYSDEVARKLKESYGDKVKIAILREKSLEILN